MIAGHSRKADAGWAGLAEVPAVIRELDDDQAIVAMVDSVRLYGVWGGHPSDVGLNDFVLRKQ